MFTFSKLNNKPLKINTRNSTVSHVTYVYITCYLSITPVKFWRMKLLFVIHDLLTTDSWQELEGFTHLAGFHIWRLSIENVHRLNAILYHTYCSIKHSHQMATNTHKTRTSPRYYSRNGLFYEYWLQWFKISNVKQLLEKLQPAYQIWAYNYDFNISWNYQLLNMTTDKDTLT